MGRRGVGFASWWRVVGAGFGSLLRERCLPHLALVPQGWYLREWNLPFGLTEYGGGYIITVHIGDGQLSRAGPFQLVVKEFT